MISAIKTKRVVGVGLLSCMVLFLLSACGTVEHKVNLLNNFTPDRATGVEVGKVTNETGKTFDPGVNVEDMLRRALTEKLSAPAPKLISPSIRPAARFKLSAPLPRRIAPRICTAGRLATSLSTVSSSLNTTSAI